MAGKVNNPSYKDTYDVHMDVSENSGTPKSSILIGFSIINHPFWGTPIFGNTHIPRFSRHATMDHWNPYWTMERALLLDDDKPGYFKNGEIDKPT